VNLAHRLRPRCLGCDVAFAEGAGVNAEPGITLQLARPRLTCPQARHHTELGSAAGARCANSRSTPHQELLGGRQGSGRERSRSSRAISLLTASSFPGVARLAERPQHTGTSRTGSRQTAYTGTISSMFRNSFWTYPAFEQRRGDRKACQNQNTWKPTRRNIRRNTKS